MKSWLFTAFESYFKALSTNSFFEKVTRSIPDWSCQPWSALGIQTRPSGPRSSRCSVDAAALLRESVHENADLITKTVSHRGRMTIHGLKLCEKGKLKKKKKKKKRNCRGYDSFCDPARRQARRGSAARPANSEPSFPALEFYAHVQQSRLLPWVIQWKQPLCDRRPNEISKWRSTWHARIVMTGGFCWEGGQWVLLQRR